MEKILQKYLEENKVVVNLPSSSQAISYFSYNGDFFDISDITKYIEEIKKDALYKSNFHGLYHSQKVCFFAYLIGKKQNLSDEDMQILMDAARYHDIGRDSDYETDLHGLISAKSIDKVVSYSNPNDLYYLKAIIEAHVHEDNGDLKVFNNWVYEKENAELQTKVAAEPLNFDRFKILSNILKDADALDRLRFRNCSATLNEKFLRTEYSKTLVPLSKTLNDYYLKQDVVESYDQLKECYTQGTFDKHLCYHSIGFDFFKLQGILKHGILSHYNAVMNNIPISRNFYGNNGEFWISVVDAASNLENKKAYETYVKNRISFLCYADDLVSGVVRPKDNGSLLPRKSDEYPDEKFVFDKIPLECIQFISIPRNLVETSIRDLEYIFCNSQYEVVKLTVDNYINELESLCDIKFNRKDIDRILHDMEEEQYKYNTASRGVAQRSQAMYDKIMDHMKAALNIYIQEYMQIGFAQLLGRDFEDNITLGDVIDFLLKKYGIDYIPVDELEKQPDEEGFMRFPFYHDDDSYLLRLSTFDLTKNINENKKSIS